MTEVFIGIVIGFGICAIWRILIERLSKESPAEPPSPSGPFLIKRTKEKRKPKSLSDEEIWARENGKD